MGDGEGNDIVVKGWARTAVVANVAVLSADAHYTKNKDGTSTEIPA